MSDKPISNASDSEPIHPIRRLKRKHPEDEAHANNSLPVAGAHLQQSTASKRQKSGDQPAEIQDSAHVPIASEPAAGHGEDARPQSPPPVHATIVLNTTSPIQKSSEWSKLRDKLKRRPYTHSTTPVGEVERRELAEQEPKETQEDETPNNNLGTNCLQEIHINSPVPTTILSSSTPVIDSVNNPAQKKTAQEEPSLRPLIASTTQLSAVPKEIPDDEIRDDNPRTTILQETETPVKLPDPTTTLSSNTTHADPIETPAQQKTPQEVPSYSPPIASTGQLSPPPAPASHHPISQSENPISLSSADPDSYFSRVTSILQALKAARG